MFKIQKHGICQVPTAPIRKENSDASEIVTQLLFGELVQILETGHPWVKIKVVADGYVGFMDFKQLVYLTESEFNSNMEQMPFIVSDPEIIVEGESGILRIVIGSSLPFFNNGNFKIGNLEFDIVGDYTSGCDRTLIESAEVFENTPYLWGGRSIHGIDCSGYTQIVAKLHGVQIPRDASKQVNVGELIDFERREAGDFVFYINAKGNIHHVGILINKDEVLHASGWVRSDMTDEKGIFREDFDGYTHQHHSIRRVI